MWKSWQQQFSPASKSSWPNNSPTPKVTQSYSLFICNLLASEDIFTFTQTQLPYIHLKYGPDKKVNQLHRDIKASAWIVLMTANALGDNRWGCSCHRLTGTALFLRCRGWGRRLPLRRQTRPPPVVTAKLRSHHARVGDDHALALLRIFLPLQLLPLQHVCNLLLGDQGLAAAQQVEQHLMHWQHLLPAI